MEYVGENLSGQLREAKQLGRVDGAATGAQGAGKTANIEEDSTSGRLRSLKNMDRTAFDASKKVMPAPLKFSVSAAEMVGIDVLKVFKIMVTVGIGLQILFWVIIILVAGYVITHPVGSLWEFFKVIFGSLVDTAKDFVGPIAP